MAAEIARELRRAIARASGRIDTEAQRGLCPPCAMSGRSKQY
jgi:hypothetical protein